MNANGLIISALLDEPGGPVEGVDWNEFVRKVTALSLAPLMRYRVDRIAPEFARETLAKANQECAVREMLLVSETRRLIEAVAPLEIMPLKGAALMLGGYYPHPGMRPAVDVDVLASPQDAQSVWHRAVSAGFEPVRVGPGKAPLPVPHEVRHLPLLKSAKGVQLEIHFRAYHDLKSGQDFDWDLMRKTEKDGIILPAPEDLALHLILHSIADLTSASTILRTLVDVSLIGNREILLQRAKELGFEPVVRLALDAIDKKESSEVQTLLETGLRGAEPSVMAAARFAEYLDLRQQPIHRIKHILNLMRAKGSGPVGLGRGFSWGDLKAGDLMRVLKLRSKIQAKS